MILADDVAKAFSGWNFVGFIIFCFLVQAVIVLVEMAWEHLKQRRKHNNSRSGNGSD